MTSLLRMNNQSRWGCSMWAFACAASLHCTHSTSFLDSEWSQHTNGCRGDTCRILFDRTLCHKLRTFRAEKQQFQQQVEGHRGRRWPPQWHVKCCVVEQCDFWFEYKVILDSFRAPTDRCGAYGGSALPILDEALSREDTHCEHTYREDWKRSVSLATCTSAWSVSGELLAH